MFVPVCALHVFQDKFAAMVLKRSRSIFEGCKQFNSKGLLEETFYALKSHMQQITGRSAIVEWCSDRQGVQQVSVFLDASFGHGSCVQILQIYPAPNLLARHSAPVLLTNSYLEDDTALKGKEGMQCLFREILVEATWWQNPRVCYMDI
jgi:hypothetical protein